MRRSQPPADKAQTLLRNVKALDKRLRAIEAERQRIKDQPNKEGER